MRIPVVAVLSSLVLLVAGIPVGAQQSQWGFSVTKDPMSDAVNADMGSNYNGFTLQFSCGPDSADNADHYIAMGLLRGPVTSESETSTTYKIRFNGGAIVERPAQYGRRAGTQEPATIEIDDQDFDFVLNNEIDSIAIELTDSIFGRVVLQFPAIPSGADEVKDFCRGKDKFHPLLNSRQ